LRARRASPLQRLGGDRESARKPSYYARVAGMLYQRQPVTATTALERRAAQLGPVAPRAAGRHLIDYVDFFFCLYGSRAN